MTGSADIPRPEHPKPQFQREAWINLNGLWTYQFDYGRCGSDDRVRLFGSTGFAGSITVPFCPESKLSGVGYTDFIDAMWYHRVLSIPAAWAGKRILLHFGGVDYESEIFINGHACGLHVGGSVSFCHDITARVTAGGTCDLVVRVADEVRSGMQPGGKQSQRRHSEACCYTRTTGIWQTVWLEATDVCGLKDVHMVPDLDGSRFVLTPRFHAVRRGLQFRATACVGGKPVAAVTQPVADGVAASLVVPAPRPWSPADPFLYDLLFEVLDTDGRVLDTVHSYAGLRKIHIEGNRLFLNNEPLYQRLVLDQGFYPDGIWTAPSDEALKRDIELSMKAGFNGARLHQKVFEERFHYWADKLGYLTWGESASWGCDPNLPVAARNFLNEWREIIERDRNHPSIIAWTPWNETWSLSHKTHFTRAHVDAYDIAHAMDPTRPVNGSSGGALLVTDLFTVHTYEQTPAALQEQIRAKDGQPWNNFPNLNYPYAGQPYLVDEWGGIKWIPPERQPNAADSWGYGEGPKSVEEFYTRLSGQADAILSHDHICGYCYTQLTDVEQEQNGIYNYDRSEKFDMKRIADVFGRIPRA
jgi:beta-galactosidase/beta-glucuronidase